MPERKFPNGAMFDTPDGEVEIVGLARNHDRIVYSLEYTQVAGRPTSTLAEEELVNNENIKRIE